MAHRITFSGKDIVLWREGCKDDEDYKDLIDRTRKTLDDKNAKYDETDRGDRYIFSEKK
jgi:hypothetical protein